MQKINKINLLLDECGNHLKHFKNLYFKHKVDKILIVSSVYIGGIIGTYYMITLKAKFLTYLWTYYIFALGGIGLGAGVHRHFSHRSFKVTRPLKIFLLLCHSITGQYSVLEWCQVHRAHHKFTDTEKDPTNINRGFWFSHLYWVFRYSPECQKALDSIDIGDLTSDKDIMFQYRHKIELMLVFCIFIPVIIPYLVWNEIFWVSFWANMFRWLLNYNQMSVANSFMHMFGKKPYDSKMTAAENIFCILFTYGEGYHNYHHVFPWDYKAAEFGDFAHFNVSTMMIDWCAKFGWVYDRKVVTQNMIERRMARTGDGSHWLTSEEILKNPVWGYGDLDMDVDDKMELHAYVYDDNNNYNETSKK